MPICPELNSGVERRKNKIPQTISLYINTENYYEYIFHETIFFAFCLISTLKFISYL